MKTQIILQFVTLHFLWKWLRWTFNRPANVKEADDFFHREWKRSRFSDKSIKRFLKWIAAASTHAEATRCFNVASKHGGNSWYGKPSPIKEAALDKMLTLGSEKEITTAAWNCLKNGWCHKDGPAWHKSSDILVRHGWSVLNVGIATSDRVRAGDGLRYISHALVPYLAAYEAYAEKWPSEENEEYIRHLKRQIGKTEEEMVTA